MKKNAVLVFPCTCMSWVQLAWCLLYRYVLVTTTHGLSVSACVRGDLYLVSDSHTRDKNGLPYAPGSGTCDGVGRKRPSSVLPVPVYLRLASGAAVDVKHSIFLRTLLVAWHVTESLNLGLHVPRPGFRRCARRVQRPGRAPSVHAHVLRRQPAYHIRVRARHTQGRERGRRTHNVGERDVPRNAAVPRSVTFARGERESFVYSGTWGSIIHVGSWLYGI